MPLMRAYPHWHAVHILMSKLYLVQFGLGDLISPLSVLALVFKFFALFFDGLLALLFLLIVPLMLLSLSSLI